MQILYISISFFFFHCSCHLNSVMTIFSPGNYMLHRHDEQGSICLRGRGEKNPEKCTSAQKVDMYFTLLARLCFHLCPFVGWLVYSRIIQMLCEGFSQTWMEDGSRSRIDLINFVADPDKGTDPGLFLTFFNIARCSFLKIFFYMSTDAFSRGPAHNCPCISDSSTTTLRLPVLKTFWLFIFLFGPSPTVSTTSSENKILSTGTIICFVSALFGKWRFHQLLPVCNVTSSYGTLHSWKHTNTQARVDCCTHKQGGRERQMQGCNFMFVVKQWAQGSMNQRCCGCAWRPPTAASVCAARSLWIILKWSSSFKFKFPDNWSVLMTRPDPLLIICEAVPHMCWLAIDSREVKS